MNEGILRVRGTLDVAQFWPDGMSDADTMHVAVDARSFAFARNATSRFVPTHAFADAVVRGRIAAPVVRPNGTIVVRLQGGDAPELHHQVTLLADEIRTAIALTRARTSTLSRPEQSKSFPMPSDDRVGLPQHRGASSILPRTRDPRPRHAIDSLRRDARWARATEHRELMAQREILKRQLSLRATERPNRAERAKKDVEHRDDARSAP